MSRVFREDSRTAEGDRRQGRVRWCGFFVFWSMNFSHDTFTARMIKDF